MRFKFFHSCLFFASFTLALYSYDPAYTESNNEMPNEIADMKIVEKYGNQINLDLKFKDEKGMRLVLKIFFNLKISQFS